MRLIDAHTHLNAEPLSENREMYIQKFIDAGGVWLVNSGADEFYNIKWIEIAKKAESINWKTWSNCIIKATIGWHPLECVENNITLENIHEKMDWIKKLYLDNISYVVAIGETWLDLHYSHSLETLELQKQLFVLHCKLARKLNLPLVIHSRDAFEETFEILKNYSDLTIYFHCRWYWVREFELLNSKFEKLYIGFCGNVTYKNAENLRETLKIVPLNQLLLETDAPYLSPQLFRWTTNHPANVKYIYDFVAQELDILIELFEKQIEKNFNSIYAIK